MKKVLSLVLALVLVLGMIPTFAADMTGAEHLQAHNFIVGDENGNLMVEKVLTRDEMTVLFAQMYGKEVEAAAFVAPANFTDANTFGWAANFISFAQASEWIVGYPDGTYQPKNVVTGKELLSALMQVLGYDFEWNTIVADAAAVGLTVSTEGPILRGAAFETMWIAVSAIEINGEGMTIGEKTGKIAPPAPVVTDLAVVSVTANNLKEVVVEFNQEVDKDTVVAANFKLSASLDSRATLLADGKTVVVTVYPLVDGQMNNQVEYTLTINGVKAVAGSELKDHAVKFTAFDATLPTVVGVTYTGPRSFEIEFSEPMAVKPAVTVKSGNSTLSVNTAMTGLGTNVITVSSFSTFVDGTTYNIQITDAQDFAGYKNVIRTVAAEYIKDVTAPVASIVSATQEYVVVEFNKPVTGLSPELFSHTFSAWKALKLTATDVYGDDAITSGTKFFVWFNAPVNELEAGQINRPIPAGTTTLTILPKVTGAEILDNWGNKFVEANLSFTVTADTTAPEIKEIKITKETEFSVEFTKNVTFAKANVEVLDADGKAITGININVTGSGKTYAVNFGKNMAGKTIIVNITGVKDTTLLTNKMADYSVALQVTDKTAPTIDKVTYDSATKSLFVFFNENVDAETALVASNYYTYKLVDGVPTYTRLKVTPAFVNDSKTVKFVFTTTTLPANIDGQLFVTGVKDVAGNEIVPAVVNIQDHTVAVVPSIAKAEATATNKVVLTYNEELAIVDINAYRVVGKTSPQAMEVSLVDGVTVVTLTFANNTFTADVTGDPEVSYANASLIKNLFNVSPSAIATKAIVDKIKPALFADDAILLVDETIEIKFTENLNLTLEALYAQDLVITEGSTTLVAGVDYETNVFGDKLVVSFTDFDADAEYRVSSKATITYIQDWNANKAVAFTTVVLAEELEE